MKRHVYPVVLAARLASKIEALQRKDLALRQARARFDKLAAEADRLSTDAVALRFAEQALIPS